MVKRLNIEEFARMGGKAVAEKYGSNHMAEIAKKGRKALKEKDPEYGKKLSQAGVAARRKKREKVLKEKNSPTNKIANLLNGK